MGLKVRSRGLLGRGRRGGSGWWPCITGEYVDVWWAVVVAFEVVVGSRGGECRRVVMALAGVVSFLLPYLSHMGSGVVNLGVVGVGGLHAGACPVVAFLRP